MCFGLRKDKGCYLCLWTPEMLQKSKDVWSGLETWHGAYRVDQGVKGVPGARNGVIEGTELAQIGWQEAWEAAVRGINTDFGDMVNWSLPPSDYVIGVLIYKSG